MYKILLTKDMLEDMSFFAKSEPKILAKIITLFESIIKTPFEGIGKPEPLKHDFAGYWSRRITDEHRLVYRVDKNIVIMESCRFHY